MVSSQWEVRGRQLSFCLQCCRCLSIELVASPLGESWMLKLYAVQNEKILELRKCWRSSNPRSVYACVLLRVVGAAVLGNGFSRIGTALSKEVTQYQHTGSREVEDAIVDDAL